MRKEAPWQHKRRGSNETLVAGSFFLIEMVNLGLPAGEGLQYGAGSVARVQLEQ